MPKNIYANSSTRVQVGGEYTAAIQLDTGTVQGLVLSPLLFDLLINALFRLLDSAGISYKVRNAPDWNHQAFADDLSLYTKNTADADTLLKLVQICQDWSGLKIYIYTYIYIYIYILKSRLPRESSMAARPEESKQWPMLRLAGKRPTLRKAGDWQWHAKGMASSCWMSRTFRWRGRSTQFKRTPWKPCVRHLGS